MGYLSAKDSLTDSFMSLSSLEHIIAAHSGQQEHQEVSAEVEGPDSGRCVQQDEAHRELPGPGRGQQDRPAGYQWGHPGAGGGNQS